MSSFFSPRVTVLSLQRRLSVALCVAPCLFKHVPVTQDSSQSLETNTPTHILDGRNIFLSHSPLPSPPPASLHFSSMADGLCRAVGLQYFHDVSQTHLGLNILFTSSQHSENHNNTELRQKFRTHYSLFRSRPRSKSSPSPLLCPVVCRLQTLLLLLFFSLFFQSIHVFMSCFVSKSPTSEVFWSTG